MSSPPPKADFTRPDARKIARVLLRAKEARGWSDRELGEAAGVRPSQVSRVFDGDAQYRYTNSGVHTVIVGRKLARAFGWTLGELLDMAGVDMPSAASLDSWAAYEHEKRAIAESAESPAEYEQRLFEAAERLDV